MGWTSYHRSPGQTDREHFQREMNPAHEILESSSKLGTFYAAVRNHDTGEVYALVILMQRSPRSYYNFSTKWMDETVGPNQAEAPAKILDLLTPTTGRYALEWRERCRANLQRAAEARKTSATVRAGTVIKLAKPLNFTGGSTADTFKARTVNGRRMWVANPDTLAAFNCRLPRDWARRYEWETVGA